MPPLEVYEGSDGVLVIYNGVTRATRIAKILTRDACASHHCGPLATGIRLGTDHRRSFAMTTTTTRQEATEILTELVERSPQIRLGQLLAHLGFLGQDRTGHDLWEIDDEEFLAVLAHHREELNRLSDSNPVLQHAVES